MLQVSCTITRSHLSACLSQNTQRGNLAGKIISIAEALKVSQLQASDRSSFQQKMTEERLANSHTRILLVKASERNSRSSCHGTPSVSAPDFSVGRRDAFHILQQATAGDFNSILTSSTWKQNQVPLNPLQLRMPIASPGYNLCF